MSLLISALITFLVVILVLYLVNMLPIDGRAKQIVRVIVNNLSITGGAEGLSGIPNDVTTPIIYGSLAFVAVTRKIGSEVKVKVTCPATVAVATSVRPDEETK